MGGAVQSPLLWSLPMINPALYQPLFSFTRSVCLFLENFMSRLFFLFLCSIAWSQSQNTEIYQRVKYIFGESPSVNHTYILDPDKFETINPKFRPKLEDWQVQLPLEITEGRLPRNIAVLGQIKWLEDKPFAVVFLKFMPMNCDKKFPGRLKLATVAQDRPKKIGTDLDEDQVAVIIIGNPEKKTGVVMNWGSFFGNHHCMFTLDIAKWIHSELKEGQYPPYYPPNLGEQGLSLAALLEITIDPGKGI